MARTARITQGRAIGGGAIALLRQASRLVRILRDKAADGLSRHARNRRILTRLTAMSERELKDIGLTRGDVADAASLPREADASLLLVRRRDERRGQRRR